MFCIEFVGALHPEVRRPRWMVVIVGLSLVLFLATMLTINTACGWVRRSMVEAVAVWLLAPVLCLCAAWLGAPLILTRRMHLRMLAVRRRSRAYLYIIYLYAPIKGVPLEFTWRSLRSHSGVRYALPFLRFARIF